MMQFFSKFNVLYDYQFGFHKNHFTKLCLIDSMNGIYKHLDNNKCVAGVFLDLSKAFDSIDYTILLHKLHHYGTRGFISDWIRSYLFGRSQYVRLNGVNSGRLELYY